MGNALQAFPCEGGRLSGDPFLPITHYSSPITELTCAES
jgi:hypothetical protein